MGIVFHLTAKGAKSDIMPSLKKGCASPAAPSAGYVYAAETQEVFSESMES